MGWAQPHLLKEPATSRAEDVGHRRCDRLVGQKRMGLALQAGGDPGKRDPRAGQLAGVLE